MKYKKEDVPSMMNSDDVHVRETNMGDMTIDYLTFKKEQDMAPLLKELPDDRCQARHWGYVLKGSMDVDYGDRKETYEDGDLFYMAPGHVPRILPGTEVLQFTPKDENEKTSEMLMKNLAAMGRGP